MGDFKRGGEKRFSGRGGSGRNRDRGPVTMYPAVCDKCGKPCEVPFKPTSGKPVYCSACFEGKKETGNNRGGSRFSQKSYGSYNAPIKSDFRSDTSKENNNEIKKQLEILNGKMDLLIKAVEAIAIVKPLVAEGKIKEAVSVVKAKKSVKKVSK